MTLIIVGQDFQKFLSNKSDTSFGLFAVSDTNITQNNMVLVNGFKKVIRIPIRLKVPEFVEDYDRYNNFFTRYTDYPLFKSCLLAFAGSTLVAQHIINVISNHLGKLYLGCDNESFYKIIMPCETEKKFNQYTTYEGYNRPDDYIDQ